MLSSNSTGSPPSTQAESTNRVSICYTEMDHWRKEEELRDCLMICSHHIYQHSSVCICPPWQMNWGLRYLQQVLPEKHWTSRVHTFQDIREPFLQAIFEMLTSTTCCQGLSQCATLFIFGLSTSASNAADCELEFTRVITSFPLVPSFVSTTLANPTTSAGTGSVPLSLSPLAGRGVQHCKLHTIFICRLSNCKFKSSAQVFNRFIPTIRRVLDQTGRVERSCSIWHFSTRFWKLNNEVELQSTPHMHKI